MGRMVFKADMTYTGDGMRCEGGSRGFDVAVDEPSELGGTNTAMNPVELLLSSLAGCMCICAAAFAEKCGVELHAVSVETEGDLDPAGFLGMDPSARKGFQQVRFKISIDSDSDEERVEELKSLIKERCPVSDTLAGVDVVEIL